MSDVKQTIQVTNAGLSPILSIAQGTGMVDFEFTVSDFQIPTGSTAVAHNIQPTGNIVSQVCTLVGNVITVTPPAYYFLRGKNYMQIQVTGVDGVNLITFLIEVWCSPNISAPVASQNPDLISQLMAMIGNVQDLDTTAKNNLVAAINEIYDRGFVDILDTEEEIEANTDTGKATGALVTKQLISDLPIVKSVTGSFPSAVNNWSATVAYPEGFTKENCIPVAIRSKQGGSSREYYNASGAQQIETTDSGVRVYLESAGNAYVNGQFIVYLVAYKS
nr:MAG TPA: hypothetical protein [Bacteriophage sp.]